MGVVTSDEYEKNNNNVTKQDGKKKNDNEVEGGKKLEENGNKYDNIPTITKQLRVMTVDEALELTGYGKFTLKMIALTGLMCVALVFETGGFSYSIPASQCDLGLTLQQKGIVAVIPYMCMIATSHSWGYFADTRGRKACLAFSLSIGSFFSILSTLAPNLTTFVVLRVLGGLFTSGSNAVVYAYIGEFVQTKHLDLVTSILSSCIVVSTAAISGIAWIILPLEFRYPIDFLGIDFRPWRLMVLMFSLPSAISACILFASYETPKFLIRKGEVEASMKVLRAMFADNTGRPKSEFQVDAVVKNINDVETRKDATFLESLRDQTFPLFKPPYVKNLFKIFTIQFGILSVANGFFFWFPVIANRFVQGYGKIDMDGMNICHLISLNNTNITVNITEAVCDDSFQPGTFPYVIGLSLIVGVYNICVALSLRFMTKKNMLLLNLGVSALVCLSVNFIYDPVGGLIMFLIFNFCGTMMGVTNAFSVELFPTHLRGMAVCLALMAGRIGSIFGTNLIGYLIEFNCPTTFYLFTGVILVSFVAAVSLPNKRK